VVAEEEQMGVQLDWEDWPGLGLLFDLWGDGRGDDWGGFGLLLLLLLGVSGVDNIVDS
jgi:hypothetical protein